MVYSMYFACPSSSTCFCNGVNCGPCWFADCYAVIMFVSVCLQDLCIIII